MPKLICVIGNKDIVKQLVDKVEEYYDDKEINVITVSYDKLSRLFGNNEQEKIKSTTKHYIDTALNEDEHQAVIVYGEVAKEYWNDGYRISIGDESLEPDLIIDNINTDGVNLAINSINSIIGKQKG